MGKAHEAYQLAETNGRLTEHLAHLPVELITDTKGAMDVVKLEAAAFNGNGEDAFTLVALAKTSWIWGVRDGGELVGALEFLPTRDPESGFIHGIVVKPEDQYHGLGTRIIAHAMQEAWNQGFRKVEATIATTNGPSLRAFLNNHGFMATSFIPDCYGPDEHRLWVSRNMTRQVTPFNYPYMLEKQSLGEAVCFVEEDNYNGIAVLLNGSNAVVGVVRAEESGAPKNLLCITEIQAAGL